MSHTLAQSQRQPHQPRCRRHSPAPRLSAVVLMLAALWLLAACGEDSKHFKLEGRMLQMNSGEFYVYSDDGDIDGFDTIKVQGGRFAYEIPCEHPFTFTVVFPNYSQLPIFAEPGKTVEVDGDASHLKALKIKGSKTNELMSAFREHVANASPPETKQFAAQFIKDHADSPVSLYLLKRYFVATPMPDYQQAAQTRQYHPGQTTGERQGEPTRTADQDDATDKCRTTPAQLRTDDRHQRQYHHAGHTEQGRGCHPRVGRMGLQQHRHAQTTCATSKPTCTKTSRWWPSRWMPARKM